MATRPANCRTNILHEEEVDGGEMENPTSTTNVFPTAAHSVVNGRRIGMTILGAVNIILGVFWLVCPFTLAITTRGEKVHAGFWAGSAMIMCGTIAILASWFRVIILTIAGLGTALVSVVTDSIAVYLFLRHAHGTVFELLSILIPGFGGIGVSLAVSVIMYLNVKQQDTEQSEVEDESQHRDAPFRVFFVRQDQGTAISQTEDGQRNPGFTS